MDTGESATNELVARLKLDVKALTLLYESDSELQHVLDRSLSESQEDYVIRFVRLLQSRRPPSEDEGSIPVALGEIVLASFLTIVGIASFVPVLAGLTTPQQWLGYISSAVVPPLSSGPFAFGLPLLDFVFSAALLLGAFYSLRRATKNLKRAGMVPETGRG